MQNDDDNNWLRSYGKYSTIVVQLIVVILGGVFLGYKMDQWIFNQEKHIFLVLMSFLSGGLAFYLTFKDLFKTDK
jgi:F0F1-type ATP synthase assembly protein I